MFTLPQPDTPVKQAAGEQLMVFAMGPMGAKTAPGLQYHAVYSYGMLPIKAPPAPAAPAAEPKPAEPKPAAAKAPAAKAPTPAPVPKPKPAVVQAAPAPEPAPTTSGCSLDLGQGGGRQAFTGCSLVDMQGSSMHLMWKSEPLASNPKVRVACGCHWQLISAPRSAVTATSALHTPPPLTRARTPAPPPPRSCRC